jgi:hypothetical protein
MTSYRLNGPQYKRCSYCGKGKLATPENFHRNCGQSDGLKNICKVCVKHDRENYPTVYPTKAEIMGKLEIEARQMAQERRSREVIALKAQLLQAARDADYASKGIWIGGLLIEIPIKVCYKCEEQYPETDDYFYIDPRSGKYRSTCKDCLKKACN